MKIEETYGILIFQTDDCEPVCFWGSFEMFMSTAKEVTVLLINRIWRRFVHGTSFGLVVKAPS